MIKINENITFTKTEETILKAVKDLQETINNGSITPVYASPNKFYRLSSAAARNIPKAFKAELKAQGDYQKRHYIVNVHKATFDEGTTEYKIYMNSRLRNIDGITIGEIVGSGATLDEATNAFIKALRAVKLPEINIRRQTSERRRII